MAKRGAGGADDAGGVENTDGSRGAGEEDGAEVFRGGVDSITSGEDIFALLFAPVFVLGFSLILSRPLLLALEGGIYGCELSELVGEVSLGVSTAATEAGFEAEFVRVLSGLIEALLLILAVELVFGFIPASFCFASSAFAPYGYITCAQPVIPGLTRCRSL